MSFCINRHPINVLLDLDNTLICSILRDDPKCEEYALVFDYVDMPGDVKDSFSGYRVFLRPGVQKFLDYLFANFNVGIFTAASRDYALFVVNNVVLCNQNNSKDSMFTGENVLKCRDYKAPPNSHRPSGPRNLDFIFYSFHYEKSLILYNGQAKKLELIWDHFRFPCYNASNTYIIDDLNLVKQANGVHCLNVRAFDLETRNSKKKESSINDSYLQDEIIPKLEEINNDIKGRIELGIMNDDRPWRDIN